MPVYKIAMRCQMENVTNLEAPDSDFQYCIKVKCSSCNEECDKWQYVSADEQVDLPGSRGTSNFVIKCKLCNRPSNLDVLLQHKKIYTAEDVPNFKEIIAFECRGCSVVGFQFGDGWKCKGAETSEEFEDINLEEGLCDYDEKANLPVSISEVEFKIV